MRKYTKAVTMIPTETNPALMRIQSACLKLNRKRLYPRAARTLRLDRAKTTSENDTVRFLRIINDKDVKNRVCASLSNYIVLATQCLRAHALGDFVPAHDIPPGCDVVGALILVFEIVGVLPYVQAQNRRHALGQRRILVRQG